MSWGGQRKDLAKAPGGLGPDVWTLCGYGSLSKPQFPISEMERGERVWDEMTDFQKNFFVCLFFVSYVVAP